MPIVIPVSVTPSAGSLGWSWVDLAGVEHDLMAQPYGVTDTISGFGSQPVQLDLQKLPFSPGAALRHIGRQAGKLAVPLVVTASTFPAFVTAVEQLRGWMDTGDEQAFRPGLFRCYRPDVTVREVRAFYGGGFEGDYARIWGGNGTFDIQLLAPDGTAQGTTDLTTIWDRTAVGTTVSVTNPGELDAYPIITVTGPAFAPGVVNATTGRSWALSANGGLTIGPGGYVIVDCRPSPLLETLPVLDNAGVSQFTYMTAASSLAKFVLSPGVNNLGLFAAGMSAATRFQVTFRPRYRALL